MTLELLHLLLCEVSFVRGISLKRKRVVWVLRVALMKDIMTAVLPIRKLSLVAAHFTGRSVVLVWLLHHLLLSLDLIGLESCFLGRHHLHRVRVNDLGLLLEIEGISLSEDSCLLDLIRELFLIV